MLTVDQARSLIELWNDWYHDTLPSLEGEERDAALDMKEGLIEWENALDRVPPDMMIMIGTFDFDDEEDDDEEEYWDDDDFDDVPGI